MRRLGVIELDDEGNQCRLEDRTAFAEGSDEKLSRSNHQPDWAGSQTSPKRLMESEVRGWGITNVPLGDA